MLPLLEKEGKQRWVSSLIYGWFRKALLVYMPPAKNQAYKEQDLVIDFKELSAC